MSYRLKLYAFEDASEAERRSAEQRFRQALEATLGGADLVAPVYAMIQKIFAVYGESPLPDALTSDELEVLTQWQAAESSALTAALGPQRDMNDAVFEISLGDGQAASGERQDQHG